MNTPSFKDWSIVSLIGQGGSGSVYLAERKDEHFIDRAALKVIKIDRQTLNYLNNPGFNKDDISRITQELVNELLAEVRITSQLSRNCINIIKIRDYQVKKNYDGSIVEIMILMDLLTPLSRYFGSGAINEKTVIKLGIDICNALIHLEKHLVIHGDVKPNNLFIDNYGNFILGDFGTATFENDSHTTRMGTLNYAAPEVFSNGYYTHSVDIYGLGMVLFYYLNGGTLPFISNNTLNRRAAIKLRLSGKKPILNIPNRSLARCVTKAIHPSIEKRYQSAQDFKNDLELAYKKSKDKKYIQKNAKRHPNNTTEASAVLNPELNNVEEITAILNSESTNAEEITAILNSGSTNAEEITAILNSESTNTEEITAILNSESTNTTSELGSSFTIIPKDIHQIKNSTLSVTSQTAQVNIAEKLSLSDLDKLSDDKLDSFLEQTVGILRHRVLMGNIEAKEKLLHIKQITKNSLPSPIEEYREMILKACELLVNNSFYSSVSSENEMNDYIRDLLLIKGNIVQDQTRQGRSSSGKGAGEIDLKVKYSDYSPALIEAIKINSLVSKVLEDHIMRLMVNYDPVGVYSHFLLIYYHGQSLNEFSNKLTKWLEECKLASITFDEINHQLHFTNLQEIRLKCTRDFRKEELVIFIMNTNK